MFKQVYGDLLKGSERWQQLDAGTGKLYGWDPTSTYIANPPFFTKTARDLQPLQDINNAYCLLNLGDSITTDHISPAGKIAKNSPAARYLMERDVKVKDFNTYGARRGNFEVMARGTFANVRLINKMMDRVGPDTIHVPSGQKMSVWDAAAKYIESGQPTIVLAGQEYGAGSSRDWAAKGPLLQGIKAVIAEGYERIHRSNLVGMGLLPLQFLPGQNAETLGLTGKERFNIKINEDNLKVGQNLEVTTDDGKKFLVKVRIDTEPELAYYKNGGILHYVLRKLMKP